jgi:hypothetical protein
VESGMGMNWNRLTWTDRWRIVNAEDVRVRISWPKKQIKIDAKSTKTSGTVTVSGKGMKFSARTAVRGVALA